eukprot:2867724-Rhodomonas_salina.3
MSSAKPVNLAYCVRIQLLHGHNDVFVRHGQSVSTAPFCGPSTMFRYARPCFLSRVISKYPVPIVTVMVRLPFVRNLSQRGLSTSRSKTVIPVISTRSPGAVTRAGSPGISTVGGMLYGPLASESLPGVPQIVHSHRDSVGPSLVGAAVAHGSDGQLALPVLAQKGLQQRVSVSGAHLVASQGMSEPDTAWRGQSERSGDQVGEA